MHWTGWALTVLGLALLGGILYWQLIIAEGTYLGPKIVVLLYDLCAGAYENIKQYDASDEQWFLGIPLAAALAEIPAALVLDVATGTGRLPRALLRQPAFDGHIIALDLSRRMLHQATRHTAQFSDRVTYFWQDAQQLPFDDNTFDAVACLEALEFTPAPRAVLAELVRVLRPGGVLLVTNRIGKDARLLPKRAFPREQFGAELAAFPLESITVRSWQMDYDLSWAIKEGTPSGGGIRPLTQILRCPTCDGPVVREDSMFRCTEVGHSFNVAADGVIELAEPQ